MNKEVQRQSEALHSKAESMRNAGETLEKNIKKVDQFQKDLSKLRNSTDHHEAILARVIEQSAQNLVGKPLDSLTPREYTAVMSKAIRRVNALSLVIARTIQNEQLPSGRQKEAQTGLIDYNEIATRAYLAIKEQLDIN